MGMGMGHPCPDAFMRAGHLVPDLSANGVNGGRGVQSGQVSTGSAQRCVPGAAESTGCWGGCRTGVFFFLFFIFSFGFESKTLPHGIQAKMAAGLGRLEHAASLPVSPGLGGGHWAP